MKINALVLAKAMEAVAFREDAKFTQALTLVCITNGTTFQDIAKMTDEESAALEKEAGELAEIMDGVMESFEECLLRIAQSVGYRVLKANDWVYEEKESDA